LLARARQAAPDIICLTEAHADSLGEWGGHAIAAAGRVWSKTGDAERKVLLWSGAEWTGVVHGSAETGTEALVSGITETKLGRIRLVGVCIPYHMAAPVAAKPRPKPWSIHFAYLNGLKDFLAGLDRNMATVIAGDFNQRIPRIWTPHAVHDALMETIDGYQVATRGAIPGMFEATIDHIAHSPDLASDAVFGISNIAEDGKRLSDHFGVSADLYRQ
jgi:exonuclease III